MGKKNIPQIEPLKRDPLTDRLSHFDYDMLSFGFWEEKEKKNLEKNILGYFKISILTEGECTISYQNVEYFMKKGDVVMIAPFTAYSAKCIGNKQVQFYYLYFDVMPQNKREEFRNLFHCDNLVLYPQLTGEHAWHMIHKTYQYCVESKLGCYLSAKLLLQHLLLHIFQSPHNNSIVPRSVYQCYNEEKIVLACSDYLNTHITEKVTVSALCQYLNISQSYLYKCISKTRDMSPKEFLNNCRFNRIETDIRQSNLSIKEIAEKYGFSSVYSFSNTFKKYYGLSPLKYRQTVKERKKKG